MARRRSGTVVGSWLAHCVSARWAPEIGDPTATGWLTVGVYCLGMLLAGAVWRRLPAGQGRGFWAAVTLLLAFLAVNKQLDLQSALTMTGKCLARAQGWYGDRRVVQQAVIAGVLLALVLGLLIGLRSLQGRLRRDAVAMAGLAVLCAFVAVRALSFHHFDRLIGLRDHGISVNFLLENTGLVLIALNAAALLRRIPDRGSKRG